MKNLLKTIGILLLVIGLQSCLDREDSTPLEVAKIKIDSVKIPQETMDIFTVQTIKTYSNYATACDRFFDYDYKIDNFDRIITSYYYKDNSNCTQGQYVRSSYFNFRPVEKGTYTFKFWNGKDSSGKDLWIEKQIVVK